MLARVNIILTIDTEANANVIANYLKAKLAPDLTDQRILQAYLSVELSHRITETLKDVQ